ncbi:hypothetical protein D3C78_1234630 [compost metagenome]
MQVAEGGGVFAIARIRQPGARVVIALGIEGADALLQAQVEVDEGIANPPSMVDAELRLADAIATPGDLAV